MAGRLPAGSQFARLFIAWTLVQRRRSLRTTDDAAVAIEP